MTPRIGVVIDDADDDVTLPEWSMEFYLPSRYSFLSIPNLHIYIYTILLFEKQKYDLF
jgi:hypothetical protein